MHGHDDPVEDTDEGDEPGDESEHQSLEQTLSFERIEKRDKGNPGRGFEVVFWEGEDKEDA